MTESQKIKLILQNRKELIDKLLSKLDDADQSFTITDIEELFPTLFPFPWRYEKGILDALNEIKNIINSQRFTCRFSEQSERMMQMLVSASQKPEEQETYRENGLKEIRDFTRNATNLVIIDPYIFKGQNFKSEDYVEEFKRSSRIDNPSIKQIHIIYDSKYVTKKIKTGIKKLAEKNNCSLSSFDTNKIHDRIWIKDKSQAIIVGTSFEGLGKRLSFILNLPSSDLDALFEYLNKENMI